MNNLNVSVVDTVFDPVRRDTAGKIYYREKDGLTYYHVWIFVDGPDMPFIESVTYQLHPSFGTTIHRVERTLSNPQCQLMIWTWGLFKLGVEMQDKKGVIYEIKHQMTYGRLLTKDAVYFRGEPPTVLPERPSLKT